MEQNVAWSSLEIAKIIISLLTPLAVLILGYLFNRRLKRAEIENQKQSELQKEEKQRFLDEIERKHSPHIEFSIDSKFFGPEKGWFIVEFNIQAKNASIVRHQFNKIDLRVRGIRKGEMPELWKDHGERLEFKHKVFQTDIIPEAFNYIFVEPGVTQQISFVSRIPDDFGYISAWAQFHYDKYTPHTIERMFKIQEAPER
jgi:hypothetical protein